MKGLKELSHRSPVVGTGVPGDGVESYRAKGWAESEDGLEPSRQLSALVCPRSAGQADGHFRVEGRT